VASPLLFRLLHAAEWGRRIADATVMLQKEVADRVAAPPGSRDYGALAIQTALAADVTPLFDLPPGAFRPPPQVRSRVVRLTFRPARFDAAPVDVFERVVRGVFLHRRKTLANALAPVAATFGTTARDLLDRARLDGSRRPEQLTPAEFGRLSGAVL
jgi:16S rRNA (adenine1518-N6/adenine1519-N6)-dimethyltransferase